MDINYVHREKLLKLIGYIDKVSKKEDLNYMLAYGSLIGAVREGGLIPWDNEIDIWVKANTYDQFVQNLVNKLPEEFEVVTRKTEGYELFFARVICKGINHHDLHIDVFPLVGVPEEKRLYKKFVNHSYILNKLYYIKRLDSKKLYKNTGRYMRYLQTIIIKCLIFLITRKKLEMKLEKLFNKYSVENANKLYAFGGSYKEREVFDSELLNEIISIDFEGLELPIPKKYDLILKQIYGDYMTPKKSNYV